MRLDEQVRRDEQGIQEVRKGLRETIRKDLAEKLNGERKDELAKLRNTLNDSRVVERLLRDRNKSLLKEAKEATGDTLQLEFKQAELARAEKVLALIAERAIKLRTEQRAPAKVALVAKGRRSHHDRGPGGLPQADVAGGLGGVVLAAAAGGGLGMARPPRQRRGAN